MSRVITFIACLVLASGVAAQTPKPPAAAKALDGLQGIWVIKTFNGQPAGEGEVSLTITADKYAQTVNGTVNERGTVTVDPSKKPTTIDLNIQEGDDAGKLQVGLVAVEGDTMTLKLNTPGSATRPKDLSVEEGFFVVVCARKK
jgi:uncharacterized protein (TIGR03067 family)